jgi:hypothetical protein
MVRIEGSVYRFLRQGCSGLEGRFDSNYNLIGRVVNDPTFGIVQNQLPPRQIQLGLKAEF